VQCGQTSHVEPSTAVLNTQLEAATEAQRWLQTLQGQRYFIGLYLDDEATQTTRTNFSEYTLNPPTSPRSLSVEFEYTLYSETSVRQSHHVSRKRRVVERREKEKNITLIEITSGKLLTFRVSKIRHSDVQPTNKQRGVSNQITRCKKTANTKMHSTWRDKTGNIYLLLSISKIRQTVVNGVAFFDYLLFLSSIFARPPCYNNFREDGVSIIVATNRVTLLLLLLLLLFIRNLEKNTQPQSHIIS
jgi:hypothetical protein